MNLFYKMLSEPNDKNQRIIGQLHKSDPTKEQVYDFKTVGVAAVAIETDATSLVDAATAAGAALQTGFTVLYKTMFEEYERAFACALEWEERSAVHLVVKKLKKRKMIQMIDRLNRKEIEPVLEVQDYSDVDFALGCGVRVLCVNSRNYETMKVDLNTAGVLVHHIEHRAPHVRTIFTSGIEHIAFLATTGTRSLYRLNKTYVDVAANAFMVGGALNYGTDASEAWTKLTA